MLAELNFRNKENYQHRSDQKEPVNLYQGTIEALRHQIDSLKNQKHSLQKQWLSEVDLLKLEIQEYKKKVATLTDQYLLQSLSRGQQERQPPKDYERLLREKEVMLQQERDSKKRVQEQLKGKLQQQEQFRQQIEQLKAEKEKAMEISVLEKIDLEQRAQLLEEEVASKKGIIRNLKKELDKLYSQKEALNKQERALTQKSKELQCYSQEIKDYNRLNELKLRQQICHLKQENDFLKDYVKKVEKLAEKDCDCQARDQQMREKMYQVKRELAMAKVKLGQHYYDEHKKTKHKGKGSSEDEDSNYSFEHKRK